MLARLTFGVGLCTLATALWIASHFLPQDEPEANAIGFHFEPSDEDMGC